MMALLIILLVLSLLANAYLVFLWRSYRSQPSGSHSYTGLMKKITPDMIAADKAQQA